MSREVSNNLNYSQTVLAIPDLKYLPIIPRESNATITLGPGTPFEVNFLRVNKSILEENGYLEMILTENVATNTELCTLYTSFIPTVKDLALSGNDNYKISELLSSPEYTEITNYQQKLSNCASNARCNTADNFLFNGPFTLDSATVSLVRTSTPEAATRKYKIKIPMAYFVNTIFASKKLINYGQQTILTVRFCTSSDIGYNTTGGTSALNTVTIDNLRYIMCYNTRNDIDTELRTSMLITPSNPGLSVLFDSVTGFNFAINGATNHNMSVFIGPSHGQRLKKIYVISFNDKTTTALGNRFLHNATSLDSVEFSFDSEKIYQDPLKIENYDDLQRMYPVLRHSVLTAPGINEFAANHFSMVNFGEMCHIDEEDPNAIYGRTMMQGGHTVQIVKNYASAQSRLHYVFCVFQRQMLITSNGITVV